MRRRLRGGGGRAAEIAEKLGQNGSLQDRRRVVAQHAAEVAERRAVFGGNNSTWEAKAVH